MAEVGVEWVQWQVPLPAEVDPQVEAAAGAGLFVFDARAADSAEAFTAVRDAAQAWDVPLAVAGCQAGGDEEEGWLKRGAWWFLGLEGVGAELWRQRLQGLLRLRARLLDLRALAVIDKLTGAYNRRYMEDMLTHKLSEARRYNQPFSLIIFDIDHFKNVNDSLGHPFGDYVLQETAGLVNEMMRNEDALVRYGGEEFAAILPQTDLQGAISLGERIRAGVAGFAFERQGTRCRITVSLGVTVFPRDPAANVNELVETADRRLYKAKAEGRNRLISD